MCLVGRLDDGHTFAFMDDTVIPSLYVRSSELPAARSVIAGAELPPKLRASVTTAERPENEPQMTTMDGESAVRIEVTTERALSVVNDALRRGGVRTYEADIDVVDRYLMDRGIHGAIRITGEPRTGRHVDFVYTNASIAPADWQPELVVLSVDIETDRANRILAIGLATTRTGNPESENDVREVLYTAMDRISPEDVTDIAYDATRDGANGRATYFDTERSMLEAFLARFVEIDPDIVTGWNVIDFDWARIADRCAAHALRLEIGRSDELASFLPPGRGRGPDVPPFAGGQPAGEPAGARAAVGGGAAPRASGNASIADAYAPWSRRGAAATMHIPGRQVIDGIRLVRYGPATYESQSLEAVSQEVLGYGKSISAASGTSKMREIEALQKTDPRSLCAYCLLDSVLVLRILDATGLLALTLVRCRLIGISLARAWTSIRAFEFLYIEWMHRRATVAPTLGVDALPLSEAPGGAILTPEPGLFSGVLVFDFRSLYPSIMRTFNIDPIAHRRAPSCDNPVSTPNGATFARDAGILPELLERFYDEREAAKARGDETASYVLKIVQNSFYGVLGASGCRFAGSDLAGAITSVGQQILRWCRRLLVEMGYTVIYGDTDSIFVQGLEPLDRLDLEGRRLAETVNERVAAYIREEYQLESRLTLEFEKIYARFFLPRLRGGEAADNGRARGRAKGYAGLLLSRGTKGGSSGREVAPDTVEVKGMEAVRRDWTPLARDFQLQLLKLIFHNASVAEISNTIRETVRSLQDGKLDEKLAYTKSLRKSVARYTRSQPPHVKAAMMFDPADRSSLIRYAITTTGPQPVELRSAAFDYDHYVEKQLMPIARQIADVTDERILEAFERNRQLGLFD